MNDQAPPEIPVKMDAVIRMFEVDCPITGGFVPIIQCKQCPNAAALLPNGVVCAKVSNLVVVN